MCVCTWQTFVQNCEIVGVSLAFGKECLKEVNRTGAATVARCLPACATLAVRLAARGQRIVAVAFAVGVGGARRLLVAPRRSHAVERVENAQTLVSAALETQMRRVLVTLMSYPHLCNRQNRSNKISDELLPKIIRQL